MGVRVIFFQDIQSHPKAVRLGFDHYLVRPRGRIGHYTTLLERILKKTPDTAEQEIQHLNQAISTLRVILNECNIQSGITSNRLKLSEFEAELDATMEQLVDLNLSDPSRQLIRANDVILKKTTGDSNLHLGMSTFMSF
jgi:hypothetical protein